MEQRTGYCFVSISPVRKEKGDRSEMVTQLLFGELVDIIEFEPPWAKIVTFNDHYEGFVDSKHLKFLTAKEVRRWLEGQTICEDREICIRTPWGEQIICRGSYLQGTDAQFRIGNDHFEVNSKQHTINRSVFEWGLQYLNTPYLWGGKSPYGIDCSGFTQIVYRLVGINLPRDAYEQAEHGTEVSFDEAQEGDLAFFSNKEGRIIHVGIIGPNSSIIHASGQVRIDELTVEGIFRKDQESITHVLNCIKRF